MIAGISREDKPKFDSALVELQMKLYLTICGSRQKRSHKGEEYGWHSTVLCTTEHFWGEEVFRAAAALDGSEAAAKITEQVYKLNPAARAKAITKFIAG
jgi:hypothetical protein